MCKTEAETRQQLNRAINLARKMAFAIAIGHPPPFNRKGITTAVATTTCRYSVSRTQWFC